MNTDPTMKHASLSPRPIEILLVDDDLDDVALTRRALTNDRVINHVWHVEDGVEALEYLRQQGKFQDAPRPDLILLDLNMPRMDGRETLKHIKADPALASIPVVVLTTSDDHEDVRSIYAAMASSFVSKPVDLLQFRNVLKVLKDYWFSVVALPKRP